jgi:hypothetical protein
VKNTVIFTPKKLEEAFGIPEIKDQQNRMEYEQNLAVTT